MSAEHRKELSTKQFLLGRELLNLSATQFTRACRCSLLAALEFKIGNQEQSHYFQLLASFFDRDTLQAFRESVQVFSGQERDGKIPTLTLEPGEFTTTPETTE